MYKISMAQIDPNGLCNSECWFCPVAYSPNPEFAKKNMPIELFESIIKQLIDGKGTFVSESFNFIYTAHYNEVLLYKYFPEMLEVLRKYKIKTIILSNGLPLTKNKIDLIKDYQDVVYGICLNIPASHKEEWAKLTNKPESMFSKIIDNINYAIESLPEMIKDKNLSIQVNGINKMSLTEYGGFITKLSNSPDFDLDVDSGSLSKEEAGFKQLFPLLNIYQMPSLIDRAGHLDKHNIITNIDAIKEKSKRDNKRVVACGNGAQYGGRTLNWIHINANGDTFICCNDYDFETIFGNVNQKNIEDIWMSLEHKEMIVKSYNTFCTSCSAAVWGN